ncbi:hypothetical protein HMPREF9374_3688 [Desmospora sp. 8437]|nr:hypothetical protein HMPREF9374_3688 [Desmospora sp. 8437]
MIRPVSYFERGTFESSRGWAGSGFGKSFTRMYTGDIPRTGGIQKTAMRFDR